MAAVATVTMWLTGCGSPPVRDDSHEILNAALWTQTSAEYAANTLQAYNLAAANLDMALSDPRWTAALEQQGKDFAGLPAAVILDLDQTVLDTSSYNAGIVLQHESHARENFNSWCRQDTAPAIPGVKDFIEHAIASGVAVFYISARRESIRDCTTRNLLSLGLPLPSQDRLLLKDGTAATGKTQHRANVAAQYRILLLVGDNLDDFTAGSRKDPATRRALASRYATRWGREWIILPNPMYGTWDTSLYEFDYSLSRDEILKRKLQQLSD
jgi:acid phosphatase